MALVKHCHETASGTAYPITVNKPTSGSAGPSPKNAAVGDLLLIFASNDGTEVGPLWDNSTNKPSGFTFINTAGSDSPDTHCAAFWRKVDGTEGSSFSVPASVSHDGAVMCILLSGQDPTTPINVISADTLVASGTSIGVVGANTTVANCLAFAMTSFDGADEGGYTVSGTGWAEVLEVRSGTTQADESMCIAEKTVASAGATGTCTFTIGGAADGLSGFQFAVAPSVAGPDQGVTGATIASGAALFAGSVALVVAGATIASALSLFVPSVAAGPVAVTGANVASAAILYEPTVSAGGAQEVAGAHIASTAALSPPTVAPGAVTLIGAHLASGAALSVPSVTVGAVTVDGATITSGASLSAPTVQPGAVTVSGATIAAGSALTAPSVSVGPVTVIGAHVASGASLTAPTVTQGLAVVGEHIASTAALNAPAVTTGDVTVGGAHVASAVVLYAPTVQLASGAQEVTGAHVASGASLFAPTVMNTPPPVVPPEARLHRPTTFEYVAARIGG